MWAMSWRGKRSARDSITLVAVYPDGRQRTWAPGKITDGIPGNALASSGRMKTKPYMFAFEGTTRS